MKPLAYIRGHRTEARAPSHGGTQNLYWKMIGVDHITGWMRRRRAVRRRFNPYIAGTPVFDRQLFFGRETLAQRALELLGSHSVQLTGERRIGKTSFLHRLQSMLVAPNGGERRSFPVFVDLEAVGARGFFGALMEETLESLALAPRTLVRLRFGGELDGYRLGDFSHDLRLVVEELRGRTQQPVRLVLLIDEADAIREDPEWIGDHWLGPLLESASQEVRVVAAGVGRGAGGPRRRHGALRALELGPLTQEDAEELVRKPVSGVFRYEPGAVQRILQVSRLRPFPIQKLCLHAVNRMLDEGRTMVRVSDVEAAS